MKELKKKILYIDMDGVCADFDADRHLLGERDPERQECQTPPNYFLNLKVINGAKEAIERLSKVYDVYFLSTPQWSNPDSYKEKRLWIEKIFGDLGFKRLILSHAKHLSAGHYLIDDNVHDGFQGKHIHFGTEQFPNWDTVVNFLLEKAKEETYNISNPHYKSFMETR